MCVWPERIEINSIERLFIDKSASIHNIVISLHCRWSLFACAPTEASWKVKVTYLPCKIVCCFHSWSGLSYHWYSQRPSIGFCKFMKFLWKSQRIFSDCYRYWKSVCLSLQTSERFAHIVWSSLSPWLCGKRHCQHRKLHNTSLINYILFISDTIYGHSCFCSKSSSICMSHASDPIGKLTTTANQ